MASALAHLGESLVVGLEAIAGSTEQLVVAADMVGLAGPEAGLAGPAADLVVLGSSSASVK